MATVIDIRAIGNKQKKYSVQLELRNGKKIKFVMEKWLPVVGDHLPVLVHVYDDGQNHYNYDRIDWIVR